MESIHAAKQDKHDYSGVVMHQSLSNSAAKLGAVAIMGLFSTFNAQACSSCGCTLSSDWENLSFTSTSGIKLDIRYDYLNQNQLRAGSSAISRTAGSQLSRNGEPLEVERYTKNNYLTLGFDYSINADWGVNIQALYIDRSHSTLGIASDGVTPGPDGEQYDSKTSSFGDVRVIGRYQGFTPQHNFGILFGAKLPTGSHTDTGTSTDPANPGQIPIDRGLQPGSGTTNVILGAFYADTLNKNWDYFVQGLFETAANSKDQFRPGNGFNLNVGLRYLGFPDFTPQIQFNARQVAHDTGANADTVSTGGSLAYLSPGIVVPINKKTSLYGFVQIPIYQNANGLQLAPRYTASVGARFAF
jgi:hypothetical protein